MHEGSWDHPEEPDLSQLVTEDDTPVDNIRSEKNQRLLAGSLHASWSGPPVGESGQPRRFTALANVGLFHSPKSDPVVPDVMISTDVSIEALSGGKDEKRSYFVWVMGKVPEVVIEIVSNREGGELGKKLKHYERIRVSYYVVYDPFRCLGKAELRAFELRGSKLHPILLPELEVQFDGLNLGVRVVEGVFENTRGRWLRFIDGEGRLILTGEEAAKAAHAEAEAAKEEAEAAKGEAEAAKGEAEAAKGEAEAAKAALAKAEAERAALLAKLAELGIGPAEDF